MDNSILDKHRRLGWKGFISNIFFGDFVEACYPYTLTGGQYSSLWLQRMVRFTSILVGGILGHGWFFGIMDHVTSLYVDGRCISDSGCNAESKSLFIRSSAYLPYPISYSLVSSETRFYFLVASFIAFIVPFFSAVIFLRNEIHK